MQRRNLVSLLAGSTAVALLATACGSDPDAAGSGGSDVPTTPVETNAPVETDLPVDTDAPPTDAAEVEVVLEYGIYGGFTTRNIAFQMQPNVYITGDGHVITPGVHPAIYPGALVPSNFVQSITPAGIDALLAAAEDAGMFADVDYATDSMIADAGTATLRIVADGEEYLHEAYALGIGGPTGPDGEETPERQALADFLEQLADLPSLVGASELGPEEPFEPDAHQFVAQPVADLSGFEIEPTVVDWPSESRVALSEAVTCTEVGRDAVGDLFDSSNELTFFVDEGVTYELAVRPALPGRSC